MGFVAERVYRAKASLEQLFFLVGSSPERVQEVWPVVDEPPPETAELLTPPDAVTRPAGGALLVPPMTETPLVPPVSTAEGRLTAGR